MTDKVFVYFMPLAQRRIRLLCLACCFAFCQLHFLPAFCNSQLLNMPPTAISSRAPSIRLLHCPISIAMSGDNAATLAQFSAMWAALDEPARQRLLSSVPAPSSSAPPAVPSTPTANTAQEAHAADESPAKPTTKAPPEIVTGEAPPSQPMLSAQQAQELQDLKAAAFGPPSGHSGQRRPDCPRAQHSQLLSPAQCSVGGSWIPGSPSRSHLPTPGHLRAAYAAHQPLPSLVFKRDRQLGNQCPQPSSRPCPRPCPPPPQGPNLPPAPRGQIPQTPLNAERDDCLNKTTAAFITPDPDLEEQSPPPQPTPAQPKEAPPKEVPVKAPLPRIAQTAASPCPSCTGRAGCGTISTAWASLCPMKEVDWDTFWLTFESAPGGPAAVPSPTQPTPAPPGGNADPPQTTATPPTQPAPTMHKPKADPPQLGPALSCLDMDNYRIERDARGRILIHQCDYDVLMAHAYRGLASARFMMDNESFTVVSGPYPFGNPPVPPPTSLPSRPRMSPCRPSRPPRPPPRRPRRAQKTKLTLTYLA
ncbi:unnamed protein product [Symbiodinium natans]|uniref:Uncharacterized protein n=1 Tax=Symbiodinium natans TaxID=878477 RepID=A0A812R5A1_9DINO|nr:unnamed protein product [Symbiodinium natans]